MRLFEEKKNCCGCGACVQVCPKKAITFQKDEDGFLYPAIAEDRCVHCRLCEKVCRYREERPVPEKQRVYAAAADIIDRCISASGGVFAGIAAGFMERGGIVFGSAMESNGGSLCVRHIGIKRKEDLFKLQGSKYVQSAVGDCFQQVKELLNKGESVLFSGTPCQVDGLYGFLQKDYPRLFTIDIVCHGVPSEQMFQDYLAYTEGKRGIKITDFRFRDKSLGWKLFGRMTTVNALGKELMEFFEPEESSFYQLFLNGFTYRENCYSCPYAGKTRPGDLSIGDFWGIEIVQPELLRGNGGPLDEALGISCLIINTDKGERLLEKTPGLSLYESSFERASRYNGQLREPSRLKPEREIALGLYREGYEQLEKWYRRRLFVIRTKRAIRRAVPKPVKRAIKKMIGRDK